MNPLERIDFIVKFLDAFKDDEDTGRERESVNSLLESFEKVLKEITDPFDNFKVTEPPDLQGMDVRKAWIAGQMSILIQIKQLIDKMTGLKE